MENPLGVITGDKELKLGISIDLESMLILGIVILLSVALGSICGTIVSKSI
jgi:hypothetical protein